MSKKPCLYEMLMNTHKGTEKIKNNIDTINSELEEKEKKLQEIESIINPVYDFEKMTLEEVKQYKINEIGLSSRQAIHYGFSTELSVGKKHFALTLEDQVNIMGLQMMLAISNGNPIPYHADGEPCIFYSSDDITIIVTSALIHKVYCTTYCNLLNTYVREYCKTKDDILKVKYGDDLIPELQQQLELLIQA